MVWTSPRTWVAGEVQTAALLNTHLRDNLKAIGDAWTAYTPTWTATGTNPAIGNGTIAGAYMQAGKLVAFRLKITMGSTTTYGSGAYLFGLPVASLAAGSDSIDISALVFDSSATGRAFRFGYMSSGSIVLADQSGTTVNATTPYTLATNDTISISGHYEAA